MSENDIITIADRKDELLSIIVEKKGIAFHFSDLKLHDLNNDDLRVIYECLIDDKQNGVIGDYSSQYWIKANGITENFLKNGGYTGIEKAKIEKEKIEINLAKSNIEANKLNKKIAKRNAKNEKTNQVTTWINIVIGILNLLFFIYSVTNSKI